VVEAERSPETCRLVLVGDFDVANCDAILDGIRSALADRAPVIEVDLSRTTLLSSAAIAELLQGASLADGQGRRLRISASSPAVARTLETLDVARLFDERATGG
jgi:anti-anti-sigma factor